MAVKDFTQADIAHALEEGTPRQRGGWGPGLRIVSFDDRDHLEVVTSPASRYLLPGLWDFSLVRKETRAPGRNQVIFYEGDVVIDAIAQDEEVMARLQDWFAAPRGRLEWRHGVESEPGELLDVAESALERKVADRPSELAAPIVIEDSVAVVDEVSDEPLSKDASVEAIASRIHALTDLSDEDLARLFKVTRETFNRWRSGVLTNPTAGSRRRLGLLLGLLEDLTSRDVSIKDWLLNAPVRDELTPYQLLEAGRIGDVAYLAAGLGSERRYDYQSAGEEAEEELVFGDDARWEAFDSEVDDDAE